MKYLTRILEAGASRYQPLLVLAVITMVCLGQEQRSTSPVFCWGGSNAQPVPYFLEAGASLYQALLVFVIITMAAALNRPLIRLKRKLYQHSCSYYPHICPEREQKASRHFKTELVDAGQGTSRRTPSASYRNIQSSTKKKQSTLAWGTPPEPPLFYKPRGLP